MSATSSSTVTFSNPFLRITSLQNSFNSSLQPDLMSCSRRNSFNLSFSPVSTSLAIIVSLICSSRLWRSSCVSAIFRDESRWSGFRLGFSAAVAVVCCVCVQNPNNAKKQNDRFTRLQVSESRTLWKRTPVPVITTWYLLVCQQDTYTTAHR